LWRGQRRNSLLDSCVHCSVIDHPRNVGHVHKLVGQASGRCGREFVSFVGPNPVEREYDAERVGLIGPNAEVEKITFDKKQARREAARTRVWRG
jgi:hypothetical protein